MAAYVTHVGEVEPVTEAGYTVTMRSTIDSSVGARLVQAQFTFSAGTSPTRRNDERDEVAYVVYGNGTLILKCDSHDLKPDIGVFIRAGETY